MDRPFTDLIRDVTDGNHPDGIHPDRGFSRLEKKLEKMEKVHL